MQITRLKDLEIQKPIFQKEDTKMSNQTTATYPSFPAFTATVDRQVEQAKAFIEKYANGELSVSDIPELNAQLKPGELPVLVVKFADFHRTLEAWWDFADEPKWKYAQNKFDAEHIRLNPELGIKWQAGISWAIVRWNANRAMSPNDAILETAENGQTHATIEPLIAAVYDHSFVESWNGEDIKYPNLSAVQQKDDDETGWSRALCLDRGGSWPELSAFYASYAFDGFASPSLRI
jgi:hypothetical protein